MRRLAWSLSRCTSTCTPTCPLMQRLSLHRVACVAPLHALTPPPRRCSSALNRAARAVDEVPLKGLTPKWQPLWDKHAADSHQLQHDSRGKAYILPMFPYPSGTLHLGHLRVYTISDVLARFKQMQGFDVLHPMAWDAFGLPAENAAIERGIHPADWTLKNIGAMKTQMMDMGGRWSWDKEFRTCDPDFYKHTQRLFLMLYHRRLAYQAESLVNWDPIDQTVLANEQVDANGCSWRSGAKVEQKKLKQWFLKIKEFQEPLLKDLDTLAQGRTWPERVLAMQRNWLGKSVGTKLTFDVQKVDTEATREEQMLHDRTQPPAQEFEPIEVFTTRADTLMGVKFIALSLNHPITQVLAQTDKALQQFLSRSADFPPDSKEGFLLRGVKARNPIAGLIEDKLIQEWVQVYVAPYVLDNYGSGAVMGVPAHDARDYAFWRQIHPKDPVHHVVTPEPRMVPSFTAWPSSETDKSTFYAEKGFAASSDKGFRGLPSDQAIEEVIHRLEKAGKPVERTENWRLRDWLISRQRYWGTPIPIVHCISCGPVPVPEDRLPVELPSLPASYFQGKTGNPLAEDVKWKKTECPKCHGPAERETDTMDTFMDSSWYFFRFLDPNNDKLPLASSKADQGMPVDVYVGGVEHAILHLLYARFISKFLATTSLWPNGGKVLGEPFKQLITQGMVHGKTYSDPATGRFLRPEEVDLSKPSEPLIKNTTITPKVSYEKMSKSKYNGVDPSTTIAAYGADATRAHMLFQAPVSDVLEWDEMKITGVQRWLSRVVKLSTAFWFPIEDIEQFTPVHDIDIRVMPLLQSLYDVGMLKRAPRILHQPPSCKTPEELVSAMELSDADLVSKVQNTIASVTQSYSETYSLNTIISDLMTLTNTIWDTPHASRCTPIFKYHAVMHLLRMLAPIAPGVAEEGWHTLHSNTNSRIRNDTEHPLRTIRSDTGPSIFTFGFPTPDLGVLPLLNPTMNCVVQFDGKRKFSAKIRKVPATIQDNERDNIKRFVLDQLLKISVGQKFLGDKGAIWTASGTSKKHDVFKCVPEGWNVVVAKRGQILNLVSPQRGRKSREKTE